MLGTAMISSVVARILIYEREEAPFNKALHDAGINLEEVIACHAWLPRNTGGDDDNVGIFEGLGHTIIGGEEAGYFLNWTLRSAFCEIDVDAQSL